MNSITNETKNLVFPHLPHDLGNLPFDLFKVIHLKLNPMHTELFATVSKTWQSNCNIITRDEFLLIKPFIDWLVINLNGKEEEEEKLYKFLAYYDVNESFKSTTKQIRAVLQELDHSTLKELEKLAIETKKPKFFKDCLHLASVDNDLKSIFQLISNQNINIIPQNIYGLAQNLKNQIYSLNLFYLSTSGELAQKGYFYKSIEVVNMISTDREKDYALEFIAKELFRDRLFDQTKKIIQKINDSGSKKNLIVKFADILNKHNERELARNYMSLLFY